MTHRRAFNQRGMTGLETAIILIAFVVVASVIAYTVVSAGIFASQKSKDAATSALDTASSQIEMVGDVKADGQVATTLASVTGAAGFVAGTGVTVSTESSDYKTDTGAARLTIGGGFAPGLVASYDLPSPVDLSNHFAASLWIKASSSAAAGTFDLVLDDSPGCGSPEETLSIPALDADAWTKPRIKLSNPSALTAVACVGITAPINPGPMTLLVDQFEGPPEVQAIYVALTDTLKTDSISFTTTPDSNHDGLLSDETGAQNTMTVSFINNTTIVRDLAWTYTPLGMSNGDSNLDYGETFQMRIDLRAVDPIPTARSIIGLEIEPHDNASLSLQKVVPTQITPSMVLN